MAMCPADDTFVTGSKDRSVSQSVRQPGSQAGSQAAMRVSGPAKRGLARPARSCWNQTWYLTPISLPYHLPHPYRSVRLWNLNARRSTGILQVWDTTHTRAPTPPLLSIPIFALPCQMERSTTQCAPPNKPPPHRPTHHSPAPCPPTAHPS